MNAAPFLVLLAVLQQSDPASQASGSEEGSSMHFRLALEAGPLSFPSGPRGGGQDLFAQFLPMARLYNDDFSLELGAPLRLRLLDEEPAQAADDFGAHLRRQDWDTLSDFGQVLRELSIGHDGEAFSLYAGPLLAFTLGEGHLVDRYDNQLSPDYHPAGAILTTHVGPARVQLAASDVLSARLFAGELRLDIGRLASKDEAKFDRYHAIAAIAQDFGRVDEERLEPVTAALVGGNAALYKGASFQLFAIGGAGSRVDEGSPDIGGFFGFSLRGITESADISGRLEGRYQGGSFRFGMFGPSYELARYSATGLSEPPLAEERLERHMSGFAELKLGMGGDEPGSLDISASASAEYFAFGRTDTDLTLAFSVNRTIASARLIIVGIGAQPRYSVQAELRQRVLDWLYAWGAASTVHFPQADGSLSRGFSAGAGVGVDFSR
ncbi:hypothetical protein [Hyalangium rubrum]|uniref:DUF5723 domain-containing protein n=1 Tax=Hyalangium rubrum TaxID=3103134 RepID=A0ABU5H4G5_9BACT|nr:hypothetical protein [Hyalangium sp. s54d21]MDY7227774.1 hypothetical protein [Hyalangium sp. s54d21]